MDRLSQLSTTSNAVFNGKRQTNLVMQRYRVDTANTICHRQQVKTSDIEDISFIRESGYRRENANIRRCVNLQSTFCKFTSGSPPKKRGAAVHIHKYKFPNSYHLVKIFIQSILVICEVVITASKGSLEQD